MSQFNDIIEVYQFSQFFCLTLNDKIFILFVNLFSLITTKSQRLSHANTKHLLFANYFCHIVLPIDTKKEESVKKINQKKKPEPVLKKEKPIRGRKIKMQQGLNDRSFVLLLRKLLVALKD